MADTLTLVCFLCFIMIFFKQNPIKIGLILINFFGFTSPVMAMNPFLSKKTPSIGTYPMGVNPSLSKMKSQPFHSLFLFKNIKQKKSPLEYYYIWRQEKIVRCLSSYPYTNIIEYLDNDLSFGSQAKFWHSIPSMHFNEYEILQEFCPSLFDQYEKNDLFPKFSYGSDTLAYNQKTNVDLKYACIQSTLLKEDENRFLESMKSVHTLLKSLIQKKAIPQETADKTKLFVTDNKDHRIIFLISDTHGHYGIYKNLSTLVCSAHQINPNISVVISGDLAQRIYNDKGTAIQAPDETKLNSRKLIKFLQSLRDITNGHLYIGLGNHDIQYIDQFQYFLEEMKKLEIPVLSNLKNGFNPPFSEMLKDYILDKNTVYFPLCFNFPNSGWDWKLSEDLIGKRPISENTVLTINYMKALLEVAGDCNSRDGCINSLENAPGELNIAAKETADKFYNALQQAVQNNPGDSPLYFVILAHEHPQRVLAFFETISYFIKFPEEWLRRIVFVFAGGHEHKPYMIQKPCFMKATDTGNLISILSTMGGPSMYGLYFGLFALRPELHKCKVIPQMTLLDDQTEILERYKKLKHPGMQLPTWQQFLKNFDNQKIFSSSWFRYTNFLSGQLPESKSFDLKPKKITVEYTDSTDSDDEQSEAENFYNEKRKKFSSPGFIKKTDSNFDWAKFQKADEA